MAAKTQIQKHVKSQHSNGSCTHMFGGPDTYVAVTVAPEGVETPEVLRLSLLEARGIEFIYCGEGYSMHRGPRSMLGKALAKANRIIEEKTASFSGC